ncbi:MAG: hypothetical protein ACLS4Z_10795 [Christensenellaceae bacterium]
MTISQFIQQLSDAPLWITVILTLGVILIGWTDAPTPSPPASPRAR